MAKTIGIDLGTTNSCVAVMEGGEPTVLENSEGGRTTPSVVAFTDSGERLVGTVAKRQAVMNPERTIFSIKRFMGRKEAEVKEEETIVPYKVEAGPNGDVRIDVDGKQYSPPEISAMILQKLKSDAEAKLGEDVDSRRDHRPRVLQRRPAPGHQGRRQGRRPRRQAHHQRAHRGRARLRSREGEPPTRRSWSSTSAAAPSTSRSWRSATASSRSRRPRATTTSAATTGTRRSSSGSSTEFKKDQGVDLSADKRALQRLYEAAEKAKIELSATQETQISLPFITAVEGDPKHLEMKLNRAKLSELTADLLDRVVGPVKQALSDAGGNVDHVILVGGMTRMPSVQEKVKELTGKDPTRASTRTRSSRSAPRSRRACWPATSRTCCCSTSPRSPSASRPRAA